MLSCESPSSPPTRQTLVLSACSPADGTICADSRNFRGSYLLKAFGHWGRTFENHIGPGLSALSLLPVFQKTSSATHSSYYHDALLKYTGLNTMDGPL